MFSWCVTTLVTYSTSSLAGLARCTTVPYLITVLSSTSPSADWTTSRVLGWGWGYVCRNYLLTPLPNLTSPAEKAYNVAQTSARNCVERTTGRLKCRFPALKYGMRLRIDHVLPVIVATVVLHNIAIVLGDDDPPDDQLLDEFLVDLRQQALQVDYDPGQVEPPTLTAVSASGAMRKAVIDSYFTTH